MNRRGNFDMVMKNIEPERATKILAKSLYKELRKNGFADRDIINFSREIIECIAGDIKKEAAFSKISAQKDRLLIG
jgi:hypothetical protein